MIKVKSDSFGKKIHLEKAECQEFQWEPGGGGGGLSSGNSLSQGLPEEEYYNLGQENNTI